MTNRMYQVVWCLYTIQLFSGVVCLVSLPGIRLSILCESNSSVVWRKTDRCGSGPISGPFSQKNRLVIDPVSYTDKGCYLCFDQETNQELYNETITVYQSPKELWLTNGTGIRVTHVAARHGETVPVICNIPCSNPTPSVIWNTSDNITLGNGTMEAVGECSYTNTIHVNMTRDVAGKKVVCIAKNLASFPEAKAAAEIKILPTCPTKVLIYTSVGPVQPPIINLTRSVISDVTCEAKDAFPAPSFLWVFGDTPGDDAVSGEDYTNTSYSHRRINVSIEDHDESLSCTAWNDPKEKVTMKVKIKTVGVPIFENTSPTAQAAKGDRFQLSVYFFAYPLHKTVTWQRLTDVGKKLSHHEMAAPVRFRSGTKDRSLCGNSTTLIIPGIREADTGVYTVTVTNQEGGASINITVELEQAVSSPNTEIALALVMVTLLAILVIASIWIVKLCRQLARRKARDQEELARYAMIPLPLLPRPRLNTPRCSTTYDEIADVFATNFAAARKTSAEEPPIDIEEYQIPVIHDRPEVGSTPDCSDYINTRDKEPLTTLSS